MTWRETCAVLGICLGGSFAASAKAPGVTFLRGHVLGEDARPQTNVEFRVVSYGTVRVDDAGEFEAPIPDGVDLVKLILVEPSDLTILYPPNGELPIPRGEVSTAVMIGRSDRQYIIEALSERLLQVNKIIRAEDANTTGVLNELVAGVASILEKLQVSEAELRASLGQRQAQARVAEELKPVLNTYLLKLKDLRDFLHLLGPRVGSESFLKGLLKVMEEYNEAFTVLDAKKDAVENQIQVAWAEGAATGLLRDWRDVGIEAVTQIHQNIVLPLNPSLVTLQMQYTSSPPSSDEIRRAVDTIEAATNRLDGKIRVLEERKARLFASLDRP